MLHYGHTLKVSKRSNWKETQQNSIHSPSLVLYSQHLNFRSKPNNKVLVIGPQFSLYSIKSNKS